MRVVAVILALMLTLGPSRLVAQDDQTLADIRQELSVLYVEIQKLKRELSTTGAPKVDVGGDTVLDRVAAIESELQRLTQQTEQLDYRLQQVVTDGTNRIGDLEFRLVELEGGDVSQLGETTTLGGTAASPTPAAAALAAPAAPVDETELAVGEQADFDAALDALSSGNYADAAQRFAAFEQAYPGSPLAPLVSLSLGKAYDGLGNTKEAARAYLASFGADTSGPTAPEALTELGAALGRLGQTQQACVTLGEVELRFPQSEAVARSRTEMAALSCS